MYTQDQYDKLKSAIALGATTVKYSDKEITYRSLSDMKRILNDMESDLGITHANRRKLVEYDRGF